MRTSPQSDPFVSLSAACEAAVARAAPAVVSIVSDRSRSSGFVWRSRLVVTADEALADETDIIVIGSAGERRPAEIVGRHPTTDVALLRVPDGESAALERTPLKVDRSNLETRFCLKPLTSSVVPRPACLPASMKAWKRGLSAV